MKWDASLYQNRHLFVADYGKELLNLVNRSAGQAILDLGCGTGQLTYELSRQGAEAIGCDASLEMIQMARENFPSLSFAVADGTALPFEGRFDTVFSNAVFHWIADQDALLKSVCRALKPGGVLVCEFGAKGNIEAIRAAFSRVLARRGLTAKHRFFYPSSEEYAALLERHGFHADFVADFDRPTPFQGGETGMRNWIVQFFPDDLAPFSEVEREELLAETDRELKPILWDGTQWVGDYRRIRLRAVKRSDMFLAV